MEDLTQRALDRARQAGASYADVRVVRRTTEEILVKNGHVEAVEAGESTGFGVRVVVDGAWGFASSRQVDADEMERVAELATRIARASALVQREEVDLAPVEPARGRFEMPCRKDPFEVPLEEKISLLLDADAALRREPRVTVSEARMAFFREEKTFASTEGAYLEQVKTESGAGVAATATESGEAQTRSYPAAFGGDFAAAGYEFIESLDLEQGAETAGQEAAALLDAPQCPSGVTDLILEGQQLALQIHESCGHPVELDRVFGTEASYAGTSFLTTDKLDTFQYGSDAVTLVADATIEGGLGSFAYDDEGVPAQRVPLVEEGIFRGYLSSRETAARIGRTSSGAMRADGWNRIPLIRMTNINLEPGDWSLDEMIEETQEGLLLSTNRSWSIDDKRLNFQFGTEAAWEIRNGRLGRLLKNPTYTGITYQFWRACDAVARREEWRVWGIPNCGKGEPCQVAHVGHGASAARFRGVRVGVMR
ncbi:MAG TPA: TldD/PmbA family protein [Armatimonadota bacterium]|jgi:TldD protein|nr:TldD/PmbA family protein [Armatimonadota bacterium]